MAGPGELGRGVASFDAYRAKAGRRPWPAENDVAAVVSVVLAGRAVTAAQLNQRGRGRHSVAEARQLAMYLTHTLLRRTMTEVGGIFRRDRTTVAYACASIEDRRDDPNFDAELDALAEAVASRLEGGNSMEAARAAG